MSKLSSAKMWAYSQNRSLAFTLSSLSHSLAPSKSILLNNNFSFSGVKTLFWCQEIVSEIVSSSAALS